MSIKAVVSMSIKHVDLAWLGERTPCRQFEECGLKYENTAKYIRYERNNQIVKKQQAIEGI